MIGYGAIGAKGVHDPPHLDRRHMATPDVVAIVYHRDTLDDWIDDDGVVQEGVEAEPQWFVTNAYELPQILRSSCHLDDEEAKWQRRAALLGRLLKGGDEDVRAMWLDGDDVDIWPDCDGYLIGPGGVLRPFNETADEEGPERALAAAGWVEVVDDVADVVRWADAR